LTEFDAPTRGRPRVRRDPPRYSEAKITMPSEMYALLLEYSHETGKPVAWIGRQLFSKFLRDVGKLNDQTED
jgi:hypothetical protein